MKNFTYEELIKAPLTVQFIFYMGLLKQPVCSDMLEAAIEDYPEYFPDEVECRKKWEAIPQEVHDAFWEEYRELESEVMKGAPDSKGFLYWMENPEEANEWSKKRQELREKSKPLRKKLHEKYYSKYGIKWDGI